VNAERLHRYAVLVRQSAGKRVAVVGERDPGAVDLVRAHAREVVTVALDPFCETTELPFPDASFDVVAAFGGWERNVDARGLVREAGRVLGPSGVFWAAFRTSGGGAWTLDAVRDLFSGTFAAVTLYAQRRIAGSLLDPLGVEPREREDFVRGATGLRAEFALDTVPDAYVAVGAASERALAPIRSLLVEDALGASTHGAPSADGGRAEGADDAPSRAPDAAHVRAQLSLRERQIEGLHGKLDEHRRARHHAERVAHERREELGTVRSALRSAEEKAAQVRDRLRSVEAAARAAHGELAAKLAEAEATLHAKDAMLSAKDAMLHAKDELLVAREADLEEAIRDRDEIRRCASADSEALRDVLGSQSWRVTAPMRKMIRSLRGDGASRA